LALDKRGCGHSGAPFSGGRGGDVGEGGGNPPRRRRRRFKKVRPAGFGFALGLFSGLKFSIALGLSAVLAGGVLLFWTGGWVGDVPGLLPAAFGVSLPTHEPNRVLILKTPPMRGKDVSELQSTLLELGYYRGPIDGVFGESTARAVSELRRSRGLSPVPRADAPFWRALEAEWWSVRRGGGPNGAPQDPPPPGDLLVVIDLEKHRLTVYADGFPHKSFPVAVGNPSTPSQPGRWKCEQKAVNVGGPFGSRWMRLSIPWGIYGVHGTNNPGSIGSSVSGGCIRMFNHHAEQLYDWVRIGTPIHVVSPNWPASVPPSLPEGSVGMSVVFLQWQLERLGFPAGESDGRLGEDTRWAVMNLEAFYGLEVDGVADTDVLCLLDLDR